MKKLAVLFSIIVMVLVLSISVACAAPYLSFNYGLVWVDDADIDDAEIKFDQGSVYALSAGYEFLKGERVELEYSNRENDLDEISGNDVSESINGDDKATSLMINGIHEFFPKERLTPFLGAGIGIANVELDVDGIGNSDDDVFAYQLFLGLACEIYKKTNVDIQYRYFATEKPDYTFNGVNVESDYSTHNLMVGLRYNF